MKYKVIYDMGELGQQVFECQSHQEVWEWRVKNSPSPTVRMVMLDTGGLITIDPVGNRSFSWDAYNKAVDDKRWTEEYYRRTGKRWKEEEKPKPSNESGHNINSEKLSLSLDECLELLGLKSGFSQKQLKEAWREAVKMYHPDKVASLSAEFKALAEKRTKQVNQAYDRLRKKRKKAD